VVDSGRGLCCNRANKRGKGGRISRRLTNRPPAGRNEEKMKMNVWRDEGDDGVTGWQPIGEPLIRTTRTTEETNR
jgi:hypothetical protein